MTRLPADREELIARMASGETFEFFFFWGHTPPKDGSVDRSCLSQWYDASFHIEGITYRTAEHWMMAEKARLFGDDEKRQEIVVADTPTEAKALGREVRNFDADIWGAKRVEIVVQGNLAKFGQNPPLQAFVLSTGNTILVKAAPRDQIWGIGLGADNERARQPGLWRGKNLLRFALTTVREQLRGA